MHHRGYILFSVFIAVFLFSVDWYVSQGVKTLAIGLGSWGPSLINGYWIFFASLAIGLMGGLIFGRAAGKPSPFARLVFHTFIIFFVAQLVFLAVLFAEDIYRVGMALMNDLEMPGRTQVVSQLGVLLSAIPFVALIYGVAKGKHDYKVHRHTLYFEDLPDAFDGFTITQISDIHAGSFRNVKAVTRGIDIIIAQHSDLFVFTGDLVNNKATEIEPWLSHFQRITAPYGKYAILGNHDYGDYVTWNDWKEKEENLAQLAMHHKTLGHKLLMNEHIVIRKDGEQIVLIGTENWGNGFSKKGDLQKALAGVPDKVFKVLLSHDPTHWDAQVKDHPVPIHLTLSGHTHGMQFGIEIPGLKWSPVKYRYPNWAGVTGFNNRFLNVNRGFGFLGFEGRVGIWPEITVIELRRKRQ
jgi:uncharacterized protein